VSELWELEKRQIEALQRAKVEALGICDWVGRLCEAVRDDRPKWSYYVIGQLLDHRNGDRLPRCLEVVGFFIDPVRIPVEVPWSPMVRGLTLRSMKKCPSAHAGALTLWNAFHGFLSRKLSELYPEVVVVFDFSQTADMLVDQHWETLRRELSDVAQFDCEALKGTISREAQAAMGVCNAKLISAIASSTQPAMQPESGEEGKEERQPANGLPAEPADVTPAPKKPKRSTEPGESRAKLIAALTKHHKYNDGGCLNQEHIGVRALARLADVDPSTALAFFNKEFNNREKGGHAKYKVVCRDARRLADSLKALNGEFSPHDLYGRRPPGEDDRDDEE